MPLEQALEHWSDADAYAAMREYWPHKPSLFIASWGDNPLELEFNRRRRRLEEAFVERLQLGALMASAIPEHADVAAPRTLIDPEIFRVGSPIYEMDMIVGLKGEELRHVEIFEPPDVPRNVRVIPDWYREQYEPAQTAVQLSGAGAAERQGDAGFRQEADYRRVWIDGLAFSLTNMQAKVVKTLHQAYLKEDPWRSGKEVLSEAGSASMQMFQVFRSQGTRWSLLIESDGDGRYRLNIRG